MKIAYMISWGVLWAFVVWRISFHFYEYLFLTNASWLDVAAVLALQILLTYFGAGVIFRDLHR